MCEILTAKSVSGLWVRLVEDNSHYDVRYLNNSTRRMWHLVVGKRTTWSLMGKGVEYGDMLRSMKSNSYDTHGWMLIPERDYKMFGFDVSIPSPLYAKKVGSMKLFPDIDRGWREAGDVYVMDKKSSYPVPTADTLEEDAIEDEYQDSYDAWDDEAVTPTREELEEFYASLADDTESETLEPVTPVEPPEPVATVEPEPVTTVIPEIPPKTNDKAVAIATIPTGVAAKDFQPLQGLGYIYWVKSSGDKPRKVAYIAASNGKCVVAYRDRYQPGSDTKVEAELKARAKQLGFTLDKAA